MFEDEQAVLCQCLGFKTGMGKPVVFPKWVTQVRVQYWILAHRDTPRTHATVLRVFMG